MQNQEPDSENKSFNFPIPRWLVSVAGGIPFWSVSLAALWFPIFCLCVALREIEPFYFMLLSHAAGVPIGIWLFRRASNAPQSELNQGSAKVISFAEHLQKKATKHNRKAA